MSTELPNGWALATIGELVAPNGVFRDGDWVESKDQDPSGDIRLIQLADVGDGSYRSRSARFLTSGKAAELRCTFLERNDLLVARMPEPLGRACIFPGDAKKAVTVVDVCVVRTGAAGVHHRWLMWTLNSPQFRGAVASLQSGSTRKRISRGNLATLQLPVPPSPEQTRIAAEADQQISRLEAATQSLRRAEAELTRYRASVLKAACEGRLVPTEADLARAEGREYETADQTLDRLLPAHFQTPQTGINAAIARDLPEGWILASLGQLAVRITSGSRDWSSFYGRGEAVFVLAQNVRPGRLDLSFRQLVDPPLEDPSRARSQLQKEDILITIVGANTGDVCHVPIHLPEHYVCQSVALVRLREPVISEFVAYYLLSKDHGQRQFDAFIYGQGRPHLSFEQLKSTLIAVPPPAEQHRIVAEVERRLSIADELAATIDAALARAARLRQSILKRAFEGKLVPQDPNDEPASVLLERIRKERAVAANTGDRKPKPHVRRGAQAKKASS